MTMIIDELTVEEVMLKFSPVYPDENPTWADALAYLLSIPGAREHIALLQEVLSENGKFNMPIIVETADVRGFYNQIFPEDAGDSLRVIDGGFRVLAAYMSNHPTLHVAYAEIKDRQGLIESIALLEQEWEEDAVANIDHSRTSTEKKLITTIQLEKAEDPQDVYPFLAPLQSYQLSDDKSMGAIIFSVIDKEVIVLWTLENKDIPELSEDDYDGITRYISYALSSANLGFLDVSTKAEPASTIFD